MTPTEVVRCAVDPHDKAFALSPDATWADLRSRAPVAWSDKHGGFWVVTGYREVSEVLHDPLTYCSSSGLLHPRNPSLPNVVLIETDPPLHTEYRGLLNVPLSPRRAEVLEPAIRQLVTTLIDGFIEEGQCDIVEALARPLPQIVLFRLLGIPQEDADHVLQLIHTATRRFMEDPEAGRQAAADYYLYLTKLVAGRRGAPPQEDLLQALLEGEVEGRPVTDDEVARLLIVVFAGGMNTVKSQVAGMLVYLSEHPQERERLLAAPEQIGLAVEELLRYVSPIYGLFRTATADVDLGGQRIAAGDKVFIVYASANRDETVFESAEDCVLDRHPNRHMAFGMGVHRCIGSHLARLQLRVCLEQVLERLPDYRLASGGHLEWDLGPGMRGVDAFPVVFSAGQRRGVAPRAGEEDR